MFASTFRLLLFGTKHPFACGGVPAACMLPNHPLYQLSHAPMVMKFYFFRLNM